MIENAIPQFPKFSAGASLRTDLGTLLPPGGRIAAFVRSSGALSGDDPFNAVPLFTTLNAALQQCRSGRGDYVIVLPGHTENISSADQMSNLVAGTHIVGVGRGTLRPTFTWTAATATFLFDVANVTLQNCILEMAGDPTSSTALSVAAPITVSAAGCSIIGCQVRTSVDADQLATIPITTTAAADDFSIIGCEFHGATTGESTTIVRLVGADRFFMANCSIQAATSSTTVGVVQMITTASTFIKIENCIFINRKAASVHAVTGLANCTGYLKDCAFGILDDATLAGLVTPGNLMTFDCRTVNLAGESGAVNTTVST